MKPLIGLDAPILQVMYLERTLCVYSPLQVICRVNSTYSDEKTHGLIVDHLGIFDDVVAIPNFDEKSIRQMVNNIQELKDKSPKPCISAGHFPLSGSEPEGNKWPDSGQAMPLQQPGVECIRGHVQLSDPNLRDRSLGPV